MSEPLRDAVAEVAELQAVVEALIGALEGAEPSDFMLSFGAVRMAWDLRTELEKLRADAAEPVHNSATCATCLNIASHAEHAKEAAASVRRMLGEALNSGDGSYRP